MIVIKRIYDAPASDDGYRVLVDRLWPRGVSKKTAALDEWFKEVAPSDELRIWFGHKPERFAEFRQKYLVELRTNPAFDRLKAIAHNHPTVMLLYAAHDLEHNQAVVLRDALNC
jgi:uncharacterized protein YeaO (DUF488 family)